MDRSITNGADGFFRGSWVSIGFSEMRLFFPGTARSNVSGVDSNSLETLHFRRSGLPSLLSPMSETCETQSNFLSIPDSNSIVQQHKKKSMIVSPVSEYSIRISAMAGRRETPKKWLWAVLYAANGGAAVCCI